MAAASPRGDREPTPYCPPPFDVRISGSQSLDPNVSKLQRGGAGDHLE